MIEVIRKNKLNLRLKVLYRMYSREEEKQLKKDFWNEFDSFCLNLPRFKYRKRRWILYNTKVKGVELKFDANRDGAYVIMELNHPSEKRRKEMYETLVKYRIVFEKYFADAIWEENYEKECGTVVSRVYRKLGGIDIHRRESWPQFYPFMSKEMSHLERGFLEIKDLWEEDAIQL